MKLFVFVRKISGNRLGKQCRFAFTANYELQLGLNEKPKRLEEWMKQKIWMRILVWCCNQSVVGVKIILILTRPCTAV